MTNDVTSVETETITVTGTPQYSAIKKLNNFGMHSWQIVYQNGAGNSYIQYSNDGVNFATDSASVSATLSGTDHYMHMPRKNGAAFGRLVFLSSTGMTATIYFNNKGSVA